MTRINITTLDRTEQTLTLSEARQVSGSGYGFGHCYPSYPVYSYPVYQPIYQPVYQPVYQPYYQPVYSAPVYRPHCW